jgi:uncharacterized protein YuzE
MDREKDENIVLELSLNGEVLGRVRNGAIEPVEFFHECDVVLFLALRAMAEAA